jgi:hypothetical protein
MTRLAPLLVIGALSSGLAACGDSEAPTGAATRKAPAPSATAVVAEGELGRPTAVPAQANLYGPASISRPPRARAAPACRRRPGDCRTACGAW